MVVISPSANLVLSDCTANNEFDLICGVLLHACVTRMVRYPLHFREITLGKLVVYIHCSIAWRSRNMTFIVVIIILNKC